MGRPGKMKIGVLSSSRADYSVYLPLLRKLHDDILFDLKVIAFGMHVSGTYGNTIKQIYEDGFSVIETANTMPHEDNPKGIAMAMGNTMVELSKIYAAHDFDLIFALGDRYEMFAAVSASTPFNIPVAHIHGGETTLGAIDNAFRHAITCQASIHFTSTEQYKTRVERMLDKPENVYNVGALSIDNLKQLELYDTSQFYRKYGVDLSRPTILMTFHPETVNYQKNGHYIREVASALENLNDYQILITQTNADTTGLMIRTQLENFALSKKNVYIFENLGTTGYLSAMKHCAFMLGNTSSGFVEASYFPAWVINLGERQRGRIETDNIISVAIEQQAIQQAINKVIISPKPENCNIYGDGDTAENIITIIKSH